MATITKESEPGLDSISQEQVQNVSFEEYMIAHFMGITSRDERYRMYQEMLNHGILYGNDNLTCAGLRGRLKHVFKEREVSNEGSAKILELLWSEKKEKDWFAQVETAIKLLEGVVASLNLYVRGQSHESITSNKFSIRLSKTWKRIIKELSVLCWKERMFGEYAGQVSQENVDAFCLYTRLGTTEILREAGKKEKDKAGYGYQHWYLSDDPREDVIANLKDAVSKMSLERVIFWLKNHEDKMPDDFQKVFRIEFVRKGGKLNLNMKL